VDRQAGDIFDVALTWFARGRVGFSPSFFSFFVVGKILRAESLTRMKPLTTLTACAPLLGARPPQPSYLTGEPPLECATHFLERHSQPRHVHAILLVPHAGHLRLLLS
jgi:hypothetical protein